MELGKSDASKLDHPSQWSGGDNFLIGGGGRVNIFE
jgi:hypothetical protein